MKFHWRLGAALVVTTTLAGSLVLGTASSASSAVPARCGLAAHRGDHSTGATENSLNAMRDAIGDGADYLELDVRVSRDGHLFLMHDKTVDRTTNGHGYVRNMTKTQVRSLRLNDGQYVPYLSGVLAMAKSSGIDVLIEMKAMGGKSTFRELASQVRTFGTDRIRVTSFSRKRLNKLHAMAPDIHELLITSHQVSPAEVAPYGAVAINRLSATPEWLASMPYKTFVYLPDTPEQWAPLATEVTAIITNDPKGFETYRQTACA